MRLCVARSDEHLARNLFRKIFVIGEINCMRIPAMPPGPPRTENGKNNAQEIARSRRSGRHCLRNLPANAKGGGGCSGDNLTKVEAKIEAMADGDAKFAAQKEISAAQDAMLGGKMGACAAHLNKAMSAK